MDGPRSNPVEDDIFRPSRPAPGSTQPPVKLLQTTIRNSAHRNPSTVLFNSSSGTTIAKTINIYHNSVFGICEDVRNFSQHSNNVAINSHKNQLTLHTDSNASDSGAARREGRKLLGAQAKRLQYTVKCLYLGNRSEWSMTCRLVPLF